MATAAQTKLAILGQPVWIRVVAVRSRPVLGDALIAAQWLLGEHPDADHVDVSTPVTHNVSRPHGELRRGASGAPVLHHASTAARRFLAAHREFGIELA